MSRFANVLSKLNTNAKTKKKNKQRYEILNVQNRFCFDPLMQHLSIFHYRPCEPFLNTMHEFEFTVFARIQFLFYVLHTIFNGLGHFQMNNSINY